MVRGVKQSRPVEQALANPAAVESGVGTEVL